MSKLYSGVRVLLTGIAVMATQTALAGSVQPPGPDFGDLVTTSPIPEPTALLAMGVGLATVVYAVRRKGSG